MDYDRYPHKSISGSHQLKCTTPSCTNKKKFDEVRCQKCIDNVSLLKTNIKIDALEETIYAKQKIIEKTEEQIKKMKEEITILQEELDLERLQIKYGVEVVVDNVKEYEGEDHSSKKIKLETHCTIIRVKDSPESVHFGHVTLVYYYDDHDDTKNIRWHYGTKVNQQTLPKELNADFWYNDNSYDPSRTKVGTFGTFINIKDDVKLKEIMLYNFEKCVKFFNTKKSQWPKQVWDDDDMIGTEKASEVLKRLIRGKLTRESIDYNSTMSELKRKHQKIKQEIKAERKFNNQERKEQERNQEIVQEEEHASLLANTPEEIEALNIQKELTKKEIEELSIKRELDRQEKEAIERQKELERQKALAIEKVKKQQEEKIALAKRQKEEEENEAREQQKREKQQEEKREKNAREQFAREQKKKEQENKAREEKEIFDRLTPTHADMKVDEQKKSQSNRKELSAKKFASNFLEEIDKDITKANKIESKLLNVDPNDDIGYNLREKVYKIYITLIEKIDTTKLDIEKYQYLSHDYKTKFLEDLNNHKEYLQTKASEILKKDRFHLLNILKDDYTTYIVPKEEKLNTLDPTGDEAKEIKTYLISFYEYFTSKTKEWLSYKQGILSNEDYADVRRQIIEFVIKVKKQTKLIS